MKSDIIISNLQVSFTGSNKNVLKGISTTFQSGKVTAIIGESGSGKSVLGLSLLQLLPKGTKLKGTAIYNNKDLYQVSSKEIRSIRGKEIGFIPQNPAESLNLIMRNNAQIEEILTAHTKWNKQERYEKIIHLLFSLGLEFPEKIVKQYPFELSGGMMQRLISTFGIIAEPNWIIADEPTKGLDAIVRKQVYELLTQISKKSEKSMILITHDLSLAYTISDHIIVMHKGHIIEEGSPKEVFSKPQADYTKHLLKSLTSSIIKRRKVQKKEIDYMAKPIIKFEGVSKVYKHLFNKKLDKCAVNNVEFKVYFGETVGILGNSGCGKSTLIKMLLMLEKPTKGAIFYKDKNLFENKSKHELYQDIQIVFQHPESSLNPHMTIQQNLEEPLRIQKNLPINLWEKTIEKNLQRVGLEKNLLKRYPKEISGGEAQRIIIARALIIEAKVLILDEPTSMLDVSIQEQIIQLLINIQKELNLTYLYITHDLDVARYFTDRLMIMCNGKLIEEGETNALLNHPKQEYSKQLIDTFNYLNI